MGTLTKLWAGRVYGTNTGNLFLSLDETGPKISGTLRFLDTEYGVVAYHVEGTFEDAIKLTGSPIEACGGVELGQTHVTAHLTQEGHLRGEWKSTIGTAGTFVAFPHSQETASQEAGAKAQIPEQFYTHSIVLGPVSLYAQDVRSLINDVRRDFTSGRPITTYSTGGERSQSTQRISWQSCLT
jgi:hypothetical protein